MEFLFQKPVTNLFVGSIRNEILSSDFSLTENSWIITILAIGKSNKGEAAKNRGGVNSESILSVGFGSRIPRKNKNRFVKP